MSDALSGGREPRAESTRSRRSAGRSKWGWWVGGVLALAVIGWWLSSATPTESQQSASGALTTGASVSGCSDGPMFYVAPDGQPGNDGSSARPWDLQTALSNTTGVGPCATVWLKDVPTRECSKFAEWPRRVAGDDPAVAGCTGHHRQRTDGRSGADGFGLMGVVHGIRDHEFGPGSAELAERRLAGRSERSVGVAARGSHLKFIDLVVHDLTRGLRSAQSR